MSEIKRFEVDVPQKDLDDLQQRLERTRFATPAPAGNGDYGVSVDTVRRMIGYWRDQFDWRTFEARLNSYPQFMTEIDGLDIHFLHIRSPEPDATPLLLTHGWPGSIVEYLDVIEPLTNPAAHGGDASDAFHLVLPSIPGYAWSGKPAEPGWGTMRTAKAWIELMKRLGYERYGTGGNDAGSMFAPVMASLEPERVIGMHVTQVFAFPTGDPSDFEGMSEVDGQAMQKLQWFFENKFAFNTVQSQQPQTLAHALADSPAGLLGWNCVLLYGGDVFIGKQPTEEFVVSNAAIYWLTNTGGSSIAFYYENAKNPPQFTPSQVPLALAGFAGDFWGVRKFAERDGHNVVQWNVYDAPGGHYAAHIEPELLVDDIRGFFRQLR